MADGRVEFEITADGRKAFASIAQVTAALDKAGKNWEKDAKTSTDNIGNSFTGMLKTVVSALSAAKIGQMLLNIGKDAIQAASDLEEVQNVVDVTFGDDAAKIESWAKNAGKQFGLTETQAKKFTSTLGAMMKSAGMSGDQIADISTDLAGLAADMASFYNLDFDTAFQKIRSGISGETEPLKQLGINMSVANLNAFALQQGLSKTFDQMTQGEQVMLRYQYLMQATADAQGDFARTSDGYANATRMLETNIESLKTKLGQVLLPVVNDVISGINSMIEALTGGKKETVLDRFADIDLKTEEKISNIEKTANEAETLTDVLDDIGKKISTNKTEVGKMLDNPPDVSNLDDTVEKLTEIGGDIESNKTGIKEMADDQPDETKLNKLENKITGIKTEADNDKTAIKNIGSEAQDGSELKPMTEAVAGVGEAAKTSAEAVSDIVSPAGLAEEEYSLWLETCDRLVKTIPGLSEIINTQTGEIAGGTAAVRAYIAAWKEGQTGLALRSAHQQKGAALESYAAELPGLELDKLVAERRVRKAAEQLNEYYKKYGIGNITAEDGFTLTAEDAQSYGITGTQMKELNDELRYYEALKANAENAKASYLEQKRAYDEAVKAYEEEGKAIEETYGQAIEALGEWSEEQKEATAELVNNLDTALKEMKAYEDEVRKATKAQVENSISGFGKMKTAAEQAEEAANAYKTLEEQLKAAGKSGTELQLKLDEANKQITAQSMREALDSQLAFIEEYQQNIEDVKNSGLIDDKILAQLSDGSNESAQYLHAMAEAARAGDTASLEAINKAWNEVNEGKEKFTDTLTQQKLAVDETYDAMVAKAQEAAKALDVSGEAGESTGKNIQAMANAIKDHVPEVASQVDAILDELNRLNDWGVTIEYGFGASTIIKPGATTGASNGATLHSLAVGMDWIPFDGFLATLHEGEAVLTAEENRIWQAFKNGQRGVDYDQLGGIMRDSIKPGGDVYLDGRVVGAVVSQMQGNQYRTMQRSGWQS